MTKRGPKKVQLPDGGVLDLWYNRDVRMWCLQRLDANGNQIGPLFDGTAEYIHHRDEAGETMKKLSDQLWAAWWKNPKEVV